jgi:hypothetical protein
MTALAELAAFDTLDAQTIDRLLAQHLVETFAAHAIPDEPVDLELVMISAGAALVWRDPGAATFHAAAEFHWSVWATSGEEERLVAAGVSRVPHVRARFAVEDARYELRVRAVNRCPGGESLESSTATH